MAVQKNGGGPKKGKGPKLKKKIPGVGGRCAALGACICHGRLPSVLAAWRVMPSREPISPRKVAEAAQGRSRAGLITVSISSERSVMRVSASTSPSAMRGRSAQDAPGERGVLSFSPAPVRPFWVSSFLTGFCQRQGRSRCGVVGR